MNAVVGLCYYLGMDSVGNKILVIVCLLFIGLVGSSEYHFADKATNQVNHQNKSVSTTTKQFMSKTDEEILDSIGTHNVIGITHPIRTSTEMTRRLIIAINKFNNATTIFSIALIVLAIAQIIATIYRR